MQLWDQLTTQATITLNLLRTLRIDPTKSAYHQLHGQRYDWNKHPLAPPGTRAIIYKDPNSRTSWGPRGTDAWYCGPALDHYQNCRFYVPMTKAYRTSGSFDLFPVHCMLPTFTPTQHANKVYNELIESIQTMKKTAKSKLIQKLVKALRQISTGTMKQPTEGENATSEGGKIQRVDPPIITTTTDPTEPNHLRQQPRSHQRVTRANQPGTVPVIQTTPPVKR